MKSLNISSAVVATNSYKLDTLQEIEDKIFIIRGVQVMIDRDLADIYEVKTKRLNEQVRRNIERFPAHYMFQLTNDEQQYYNSLRSQIATLKNDKELSRSQFVTLNNLKSQIATSSLRGKHSKYNSYAFTEQGVSMLASVLKSETAVQTSIIINSTIAYSIGSSVKDAGKRCFAVTLINEEWMVKMILERIS
ncbi:MAG: ORF6N domain-containing protein [Bacteroidales bacterium]|nr:ORF6N domain-containing protein [Bacteroidales bacterium]